MNKISSVCGSITTLSARVATVGGIKWRDKPYWIRSESTRNYIKNVLTLLTSPRAKTITNKYLYIFKSLKLFCNTVTISSGIYLYMFQRFVIQFYKIFHIVVERVCNYHCYLTHKHTISWIVEHPYNKIANISQSVYLVCTK